MIREGQTLRDTYRVEKKLSGSKTAYRVQHLSLKTPLVMELVTDEAGIDELDYEVRAERKGENLRRFQRVEQLAQLSHPNLAKIVDVIELETQRYLVREWVDGYTLRNLVEQSLRPLDQATTSDIGKQLLDLVETLTELDPEVVLGTLCPDYIALDADGRVRVIDYGIAVHSPGKTEFEPFSCPELLGGSELDLRAELYSIAATLYFAVTGAELPPIWDRITQREAIPSPLDLEVQVDGRFWRALEKMLSLAVDERPQSVEETLALLDKGTFKATPDSSPATWYPEQDNLMLAGSAPFQPITSEDWILKMVQAAVVGNARQLEVKQGREFCALDFRLAAPEVPPPQALLNGLTTDRPIGNSMVAELITGLRVIGEFRDFRVVLDDWKQSWTLTCRGGRISTHPGKSEGRSGVVIQVRYEGKGPDRAKQSAEELVRLVRKTRLCPIPITVDRKPLEPGRGTEISELPKEVSELYLASASFPTKGGFKFSQGPSPKADPESPLTAFSPAGQNSTRSHVDVRCLIAPGESNALKLTLSGYHFLRRPSRVLWYRRGVLCGERHLEKKLSLQLDIHINGDDLASDAAGLKLSLPDWIQVGKLRPVLELERILPITRMKLKEYWEELPTDSSPKLNAFAGMLGAPSLLLFFSTLMGPGLLVKKAVLTGLMKTGSVAGGLLGYSTASDHLAEVRKACLKAIDAFKVEEIG